MNIPQWYAVSIAAGTACLLVVRIGSIVSNIFMSRFQVLALKHLVYPLLVRRRYFTSLTRLQGLAVGSYVIVNGFCMGLGIKNSSDLLLRSGTMTAINMIPLFLGGRTSLFADFLGVSLHTYYIAHHWVGRVVIIQGMIHVGLALAAGRPWTFDSSQISGISSASALALLALVSLFFVRRLMFEFFLKVHLLLAFVAVIALLKHVSSIKSAAIIFPIVSLSIWAANLFWQLVKIAYRNLGRHQNATTSQATITHFKGSSQQNAVNAMRVTVRLAKEMKARPGQYYYIFFSDMGTRRRFQSHPFVAAWWDFPMAAKSLSFLVQPQSGLTAELTSRTSIQTVTLDGPYGKDLHLDKYETVILTARGIGIAGILSHVRHMADRKALPDEYWAYQYRRGLITRKIDVYWVLEDNDQDEWVADWLKHLHELDSKNLILTFTCFYPNKQRRTPPVSGSAHWRFLYQTDALPIINSLMVKQIQRSHGKTKIAVCGDSNFSDSIRGMVLEAMNEYRNIEFTETDFQPQTIRQKFPGIHKVERDNEEMHQIMTRKIKRRTKMPRSSKLSIGEDKERLVKRHSGLSASRLETVNEKSDTDSDFGPQSPGMNRLVVDIV